MSVPSRTALRVGMLGWGAIGQTMAGEIDRARSNGDGSLEVTAVGSRWRHDAAHPLAVPVAELGRHCDLIVEAAGPQAVREHVQSYLAGGTDVLLLSLGALADPQTRQALDAAGPGRLMFCSGAIGGIDLLEAARLHGTVRRVRLETTKPAAVLRRDWMSCEQQAALQSATSPLEVFRGSVAEAVTCFPESLNVSAALALAAGSFEAVEVIMTASPTATSNSHVISIEAECGTYHVSIANAPSPDNPRTSHITAWAALRSLRGLVGTAGVFV